MANPNIVNVTSILGKTAVANVSTVSSNVVVNSAGSNTIVKINTLMVSNINATATFDFSATVFRSSIDYPLASTIAIPSDASLVVLSKDTAIYLEEGDAIRCLASANSAMVAVCSYEIIS
jgi:hypothetical protein